MSRSILFVLLACILVVVVLGALDVIPLGLGGGADPDAGAGPGDLLEGAGTDDPAGTLKGRGAKPGEEGGAEDAATMTAEPVVPAEVRGTTRNGAVVRGRVVRAEGRIPVAGAGVTLSRPDSVLAYLRARTKGRFDDLVAVTGTDGRFAFLDITPSEGYVVRAQLEGYAVSSSDALDLRGRETVDLGDLELGPGGGLTGVVLDASKKPVPLARVAVTWRISNRLRVILSDPETAPEREVETRTGEDGRFLLEALEPRPKTLFVVAPSGATDVRHSVPVEAGKTRDLGELVLPGRGVVAGRVVWADGEPIVGARVFAKTWNDVATRTVETDATGAFRIEWLPEARRYGFGVLVEGLPVHMEQNVELGREDLLVEFPVPGSLAGTVVRAATGEPVSRFAIQLDDEKQEPDFMLRFLREQVKRGLGPTPFDDGGGAFRFPRVAAGTYTVRVTAAGFPEAKRAGVVVTSGETTEVRIEIPDGNVAKGKVLRSTGAPMGGARLFVIHQGVKPDARGVRLHGYVDDREPDAATRGDGSFELPPQTPGRYDVIATHEETLPAVLRGVDLRGGDAADLEIRLPPSGGVRGMLLDEHAHPVKGGEEIVVLYPNGLVRTVDVESDGRFDVKGLPVGRCLVRWLSMRAAARWAMVIGGEDGEAKRDAYDTLRQEGGGEHEIVDGGTVEVTLRLPRRVKVTGRILVEGEPDPRAQGAWLNMPGAPRWIHLECGTDGRYEKELEPGPYRVWVPAAGSAWRMLQIAIPETPTFQLDLEAPAEDR